MMTMPWPTFAADESTVKPAHLPPMLQSLVDSGKVEVLRSFNTDVPGLTGYAVEHGGQGDVVYGMHEHLFVGQLISAKGQNLTKIYAQHYLPKPDLSTVVKKLKAGGHLIAEGAHNAPLIYAMVDPDCIFCYHFFNATRKAVRAGKLQVQWVLMGFLKSSSQARAEAILTAKDPLAALRKNYKNFDTGHEEGGMPPIKQPSAKMQTLLSDHFKAMQSVGSNGTPTLLFKGTDGKWTLHVGLPSPQWLENYQQGKPV
ncbi:MAG: thiol:disulfide interchange protein DsbG, partial [Sinobacteraceae bacterium]|nr:thiol:disulfide interchange protein DsbG [Nevskiaceae bacterium]